MHPEEVSAALSDRPSSPVHRQSPAGGMIVVEERFPGVGVTAYYTDAARLAGVAVDALTGPQVTLDGTPLVARVPSELEQWLIEHTHSQGLDLHYLHEGTPASADLGLVLRAQRAGDLVLTRPLFLIHRWTTNVWDCVPGSEWRTF